MGDADDSYDFRDLTAFVDALRAGGELVMGNRFQGGIARGAMPPLHRYLGNPVPSFLGRRFFNARIGDFHCGLRGFRRDAVLGLGLRSPGMEFASEMAVKAVLHRLDVRQVATTLSPDGRSRPPRARVERFRRRFSVERGCILGTALLLPGTVGSAGLIAQWGRAGFGAMDPVHLMRLAIPSMLACVLGLQAIFTSFPIGLIDARQD